MKKFFKDFFDKAWTIYEKVFWTGCVAGAGIIIGFLLSPIKSGCLVKNSVFSNNSAKDCGSGNSNVEGGENKKQIDKKGTGR